jgi:putative Mg2+ transporter-C (MgtC) family protein
MLAFGGPAADSGVQLLDLLAALVLCGLIGFEREMQHKSAGLRTHALIGLASALFMQVSKFGFGDVIGNNVRLDPSRIASLVVSGIGFVGAGLIFVHRGDVRGLTTASTVWFAAAVGLACGANLVALAAILTAVALVIAFVVERFERNERHHEVHAVLRGGDAAVDAVAAGCRAAGYALRGIATERRDAETLLTLNLVGDEAIEPLLIAVRSVASVTSVRIDAREVSTSE